MRIAKTFAIIAAVLLVAAIAIATLGPDQMSLADGIAAVDKVKLVTVEHYVRYHLSDWTWNHFFKAVLGRPLWLVPAALGLVFAGASATVTSNGGTLDSRRRRS